MEKRGRKKTLDEKQSELLKSMYASNTPINKIINVMEISLATFYRYKSSWELNTLNIAIETTSGRYQKDYFDEKHLVTTFEKFEIALIRKLAAHLNSKVKLWPCSFKKIVDGSIDGAIDIAISGIADTHKRRENYLFSSPYVLQQEHPIDLFGKRELQISCDNELEGLSIGVLDGTIHSEYLWQRFKSNVSIKRYKTSKLLASALSKGLVDVVMAHRGCGGHFEKIGAVALCLKKPITHKVDTCIAIRNGHILLHEKIDEFLYFSQHNEFLEKLNETYFT